MMATGDRQWAIRMADSVMQRYAVLGTAWTYEWGLMLKALLDVWRTTGDSRYFDYVKTNVDTLVDAQGHIQTYHPDEHNLDHINPGKVLFPLFRETGDPRYEQAARRLRDQLLTQPRTRSNGFWHKQIYPYQMWLDGIYMASPFLAEYAATFGEPDIFDDIAHQIMLVARHTRASSSGLHYHAWDESQQQQWADPVTGCSPHFWGRAMGWYMMAIPDVLDYLPENHLQRGEIITVFVRAMAALVAVQDQASGVWYQVLDQGSRPGNYLEASASCMFAYALAKGIERGYLDPSYSAAARRAYQGILAQFVEVDQAGLVNLNGICSVAGLGGTPYRDGSFAYYVSEKVVANDSKGVGPFVMAFLRADAI
jgi:unsaturated rhamnogalacturonyl hydrolase